MAVSFCDAGGDHGLPVNTQPTSPPTALGWFWTGINTGTGTSVVYDTTVNLGAGHKGSIKVGSGTAGAINLTNNGAFIATAKNTGRVSCYVKLSAIPTSATGQLFGGYTSATTGFSLFLGITTTGKVVMLNGNTGATVLATGTTTILANTVYRLSFTYNITSTTVFSISAYINGRKEFTVTTGTLATTTSNLFGIGFLSVFPGANINAWFSDLYIDDVNGVDPGDIRVTPKRPAGLGAANAWNTLGGTAANRWSYVNERPVNTTNNINQTVASALTEEFTVESALVGDTNIATATYLGGLAWVYYKNGLSSGTSTLIGPVGNSTYNNSTTYVIAGLAYTSAAYPSGNAVIGMISSATQTTFLADCGLVVAYQPRASTLPLLGVG